MNKYLGILLIIIFIEVELKGQQRIIDSNTALLDRLEARYKSPCINYEPRKVGKKTIKTDRGVIDDLNRIYHGSEQLGEIINLLKKLNYKESGRIERQGEMNGTILFEKSTEGQLNGYVEIVYSIEEQKLLSKKIMIGTKTVFFCETKELWSNSSDLISIELIDQKQFQNAREKKVSPGLL